MKPLQKSSRNLRKALGLGLLGLLFSVVPTGQAGANVTVTDQNLLDGFVIDNQFTDPSNNLTVQETLRESTLKPIKYLTSFIVDPSGIESGIVTPGKTYFDKVVTFDNATNAPVTWTWEITNETGMNWTDYHFEFWDSTFTTRLTNLTLIGSSSTKLGNYTFLTEPVGYGSDPTQPGTVLSYYGSVPGEVHAAVAPGNVGVYTMEGNLMEISGLSSGSFGLRQIATVVPEPGSVSLLGVGLAGLLGFRKMNKARTL